MLIRTQRKTYGFWVLSNTYYNNCRWICVTDDFGNLVKINYDAARVSLG